MFKELFESEIKDVTKTTTKAKKNMTSFINQALLSKDLNDDAKFKMYKEKAYKEYLKIKKALKPKSKSWGEDEVLWRFLNKADITKKFKLLDIKL